LKGVESPWNWWSIEKKFSAWLAFACNLPHKWS